MEQRVNSDAEENDPSAGWSPVVIKRLGDEFISPAYMRAVRKHALLTHEREIELGKVIEPIIVVRKRMDILNKRLAECERQYEECDPEEKEILLCEIWWRERQESSILQTAQFQDARNELVTHNLRWVIAIAKRFRNKGLPFKDVIQEGNIGLMRAAERYEWRRGFRFTTYSHWWIRQGITRAITDDGSVVRLPSYIYELLPMVMASKEAFITEHGCEPTYEELATRCGETAARIEIILTTGNKIISLESPAEDDSDFSLHDILPHVKEPYEDIVFTKKRKQDINALLNELTPKERDIIERRFGMNGHVQEQTLREIAELKGLSHERVRQIEKKACSKLVRILSKEEFKDYRSD